MAAMMLMLINFNNTCALLGYFCVGFLLFLPCNVPKPMYWLTLGFVFTSVAFEGYHLSWHYYNTKSLC